MIVRPFKAIRPSREKAEKVAALPYDVMNSEEAREMVKDNPYSFLHVDKAEIDLDREIDHYDSKVYEKAKENIEKFLNEGTFIKDSDRYFYVYKLKMGEVEQTGIVGAASIDDYIEDRIKKHEFTREEKELDRIRHVDVCNANTGPIFLTYPKVFAIDKIVEETVYTEPEYDFTSEDGVKHTVWIIKDEASIKKIEEEFNKIPALYIADGHHRAASAVKVGKKRRDEKKDYTGEEGFNFFLSVIFPSDQLNIMDYNRIIKDLNGLSEKDFMDKVSEGFEVERAEGTEPFKPSKKGEIGMYLGEKWYKLTAKEKIHVNDDVLKDLDISLLTDNIIAPVLGIENQRTSDRIDFVGGIRGLKELERRCAEDNFVLAFSMYPTSIDDLMKIADSGRVMPPKSTWFEPKLRSGLFIHELEG